MQVSGFCDSFDSVGIGDGVDGGVDGGVSGGGPIDGLCFSFAESGVNTLVGYGDLDVAIGRGPSRLLLPAFVVAAVSRSKRFNAHHVGYNDM